MLQVIATFAIIALFAWIIAAWSRGGSKDDGCGPT